MFLEKCEKKTIDGVTYDITNNTQVEIWNCKSKVVEIYNYLDPGMMEMQLTHETYISWKKELIKLLKEFDKLYIKHIKNGYIEMNQIHMTAMKPITNLHQIIERKCKLACILNLLESNLNLHYLELIEKKKDVPSFRHEALEEKFCEHLTRVCEIFRDFGTLQDPFNIKQMLHVLKTRDWAQIPPLAFYFQPLQDALTDVRTWMLKMNDDGILRVKEKVIVYIVEDNTELMEKTVHMVQKDMTAQWLGGDELKQDQFKFIFKVCKVIYDCVLKDPLINEDPKVLDGVVSNLVAYHTVLDIKRILDTKILEKKKAEEKAEREGKKVSFGGNFEEEKKVSAEEMIYRQRIEAQLNKSTTSQFSSEQQKQKEADKQEIEKYGRMWIWENYMHPNKREQLLSCAEKLNHLNPHVLQDIEDYILLQGFKGKRQQDIKKAIDMDLQQRRLKKKNRSKEDEEEEKVTDQKRNFLNVMRPPYCWNFFEDSEDKTPHVLRAEADPKKCYIDGRVEKILEDISQLGHHVSHYEEVNWKRLRTFTVEIFKHMAKHEGEEDESPKK